MRAVLERDFLREISRGRAFLVRGMVAGVLAAAVLIAAAVEYDSIARSSDEVGAMLFRVGSLTLIALLALWTPPMTVEAILEERQQGTLALVLAAPVRPAGLAVAKIFARSGAVLAGALAAIPCLSVPLLLGGVPWTSVLALAVTVAAVVLEMAAWSVMVSSFTKRLATAVVLAFLLPAVRWAGWGFLLAWAEDHARGLWATNLVATFPGGPIIEMVEPGTCAREFARGVAVPPFWRFLLSQPWWGCLAFSVLVAAVAAAVAAGRLAREEEPFTLRLPRPRRLRLPRLPSPFPSRRRPPGRRPPTFRPFRRLRLPALPAFLSPRRLFGRGRPGLHPVVWKEARQLNTATSRGLYYTVLAVMLFLLGAGIWDGGPRNPRSPNGLLAAEMTLLCLVGCVQGAAAFGHERSQGSYDLLRTSPLAPRDIVLGKVVGGVVGLGFLAAVPLSHAVLASLLHDPGDLLPSVTGVLLCLAVPVYWTVQGLSCSAKHPRTRPAMVRSLALFGLTLVGLPLLGGLGRGIGVLDRDDSEWLLMACPPATLHGTLEKVGEIFEGRSWSWTGEEEKALVLCALVALGGLLHWWLMRYRLAGRFEEDREE